MITIVSPSCVIVASKIVMIEANTNVVNIIFDGGTSQEMTFETEKDAFDFIGTCKQAMERA